MNGLVITIGHEGDRTARVRITGEVDIATAPQLTDAVYDVIAETSRYVLLDMAEVSFLDSTGIGALLTIKHAAAEQDVLVRVVDPNRRVVRVLQLTGLLEVLQDGSPCPPAPRPPRT